LFKHKLRERPHRNVLQLYHDLISRPYAALKNAALATADSLRRVDWDARAVFLITALVPWTLHDALFERREARKRVAGGLADDSVQCEEYAWTIAVVSDVAEALLHLWELDILHLDICTRNVTIAPYGQCASGVTGTRARPHAVLIDFGSSVNPKVPGSLRGCSGNRQHLAPEVLNACVELMFREHAREVDLSRQPVFELGILAYEVARGGAHPLPGYPETWRSWNDTNLPKLPEEFPPAFSELLVSCVREVAADRPSLGAVVRTLRWLRKNEGLKPAFKLPPWVSFMRIEDAKARCAPCASSATAPLVVGEDAPALQVRTSAVAPPSGLPRC
jgi:hypothetical protein